MNKLLFLIARIEKQIDVWSASGWRSVLSLAVLTLLARLPVVVLIALFPNQAITSDSPLYNQLAVNLLKYGVFSSDGLKPELLRTPGYPLFLASVYAVCGTSCPIAAVFLQQTVLALGIVVLMFWIAKHVLANDFLAFLAAAFYSFSPITITLNSYLLTETLYLLLFLLSMWLMLLNRQRSRWGSLLLIASGVSYGAATLVRPIGIAYFIVPLVAIVWRTPGRIWRRALAGISLVASFQLALAPWAFRNYQVSGRYAITTLGSGLLLHVNLAYLETDLYGLTYHEAQNKLWDEQSARLASLPGATEADRDAVGYQLAFEKIRAHPIRYLWTHIRLSANGLRPGLSFLNQLINPKEISYNTSTAFSEAPLSEKLRVFASQRVTFIVLGGLMMGYTMLLCVFGAVGAIVLAARRQWWLLFFLAAPLIWTLLLASGTAEARIRMPTDSFTTILAVAGAQALWRYGRSQLAKRHQSLVSVSQI